MVNFHLWVSVETPLSNFFGWPLTVNILSSGHTAKYYDGYLMRNELNFDTVYASLCHNNSWLSPLFFRSFILPASLALLKIIAIIKLRLTPLKTGHPLCAFYLDFYKHYIWPKKKTPRNPPPLLKKTKHGIESFKIVNMLHNLVLF